MSERSRAGSEAPGAAPIPVRREGSALFRPLDPVADRPAIESLLARSVPGDYLLTILDRWLLLGTLLGGYDGAQLVALQRLDDLEEGEGWVGGIRVAPERRRQGWGHRLTDYALEVARARRMHTVRLTIEDTNTASRALARSLGFESVLPLAHVVGRCPRASESSAPLHMLTEAEAAAVPGEGLEGTRAMRGFWMTTVPRAQRFTRASSFRLRQEARVGHLAQVGPNAPEGLCVLAGASDNPPRAGRRFQLMAPLGSDLLGTFRAASRTAREAGCELEGYLPSEGATLPTLEREGWRTGEHAFWGVRLQLYEKRT